MDASTLPVWAQGASLLAIALVASIVGVFKYLKTEQKPEDSSSSQSKGSSASFVETRVLKDLTEALRDFQDEQSRDAKKSHRLMQDLKESINELNETMIVHIESTMNLIRFIKVRDRTTAHE